MILQPGFFLFFPVKLCDERSPCHNNLRERSFLLPSDAAVSRCGSSVVDSAVSSLCRLFACLQIQQEALPGEAVPTHGPSGAALIYGSGAEPGRQGGAPSGLPHRDAEGCPSAPQRQPPPGYHPPAARQPPEENGFARVPSGRGHEGPDWGLRTTDIHPRPVLEAGRLRSRGPREELWPESPGEGPAHLFQLLGAPGVPPWAGGRLPPVSASVSTWLLLCVRASSVHYEDPDPGLRATPVQEALISDPSLHRLCRHPTCFQTNPMCSS